MTERKIIRLQSWPDPILQEQLEEMGFFRDDPLGLWVRYCDANELEYLVAWLKKRHITGHVTTASGRGQLTRLPRLSANLMLRKGGSPNHCSLCGTKQVPCYMWVEGDDTDSIYYPGARHFYLCGVCVQKFLLPHPRLYTLAQEKL
ncbi:MAG: hypothetical protein WCJ97_00250 [Phycisphaerae bacterium]